MPRNLVILASGVTKSRYSSSPPCARKSKEDGQGCGEAATDTALAMKMATAGGAMDATTEKKCGRMLRVMHCVSWDRVSVTFKYHALRLTDPYGMSLKKCHVIAGCKNSCNSAMHDRGVSYKSHGSKREGQILKECFLTNLSTHRNRQ